MIPHSESALVIAGHGSTRNPDSSAPTLLHAETLRQRGIFAEVVACFWKEKPFFREALSLVESRNIYVVPNFISEGYFTKTVIPREMELAGPTTSRAGRLIHYCQPTGNHGHMTELLIRRAREVAANPEKSSLLIVGHGTNRDANSAQAARNQAETISVRNEYAEVLAAYMEEPPLIAEWYKFTAQPNVVVVPFFISDGLHSYQEIPLLLGITRKEGGAARDVFRHNPHHLNGRQLYYGRAIGTDPGFADIILDQVAAAAGRNI